MVVAIEVTKLPEIGEDRGWKFWHLKLHGRQELLESVSMGLKGKRVVQIQMPASLVAPRKCSSSRDTVFIALLCDAPLEHLCVWFQMHGTQ